VNRDNSISEGDEVLSVILNTPLVYIVLQFIALKTEEKQKKAQICFHSWGDGWDMWLGSGGDFSQLIKPHRKKKRFA